jgi:LuxR family maltose regulon positive regulatory protein
VLLTDWVMQGRSAGKVVWASLDEDDDDPTRLWTYLLAGIERVGVFGKDCPLWALRPTQGVVVEPSFVTRHLLPALANEIIGLPRPIVIIIDDAHYLRAPAVLQTLELLLRHPLPPLRIVLSARSDPLLPLHRYRADGSLTEIRAADLAFTPDETHALIGRHGVQLSPLAVSRLVTRTEGWAAGLRLTALSLQTAPEPERLVADLAGDQDSVVADYILHEVLQRQPASVRQFLLRTSVLPEFTAGLAGAVSGNADAARLLAQLESTNSFVVGSPGGWYRYHHLLREVLGYHLQHADADLVPELNLRAALWHAQRGEVAAGVRHAAAAGDWRYVAALILGPGLIRHVTQDEQVIRRVLARFPSRSGPATDPEYSAAMAIALVGAGDLDRALASFEAARRATAELPQHRLGSLPAQLAVVGIILGRLTGDSALVLRSADEALAAPANPAPGYVIRDDELRAVALSARGTALVWEGHLDDAVEVLAIGRRAADLAELEGVELYCLGQQALAHAWQGELRRAEELGQEFVALAEESGLTTSMEATSGYLAPALVAIGRDDLDRAGDLLRQASRACGAGPEPAAILAIAVGWARLAIARGVPDLAKKILHPHHGHGGWLATPFLRAQRVAAIAEADIRGGHPGLAESEIDKHLAGRRPGALESLELARARLAHGDGRGARAYLNRVIRGELGPPWLSRLVPALVINAVAARRAGDDVTAAASLSRAIVLAEAERLTRPFVDYADDVRDILDCHPGVLRDGGHLLSALGPASPPVGSVPLALVPHASTTLAKPLTEREQVVLTYLPSMLSTGEIADELCVSVNTVKSHLRGIYRKLDATGRRDAVMRARQSHLL